MGGGLKSPCSMTTPPWWVEEPMLHDYATVVGWGAHGLYDYATVVG